MNKVEIYTSNTCGYCIKAKQLLEKKDVTYEEINISDSDKNLQEAIQRSNGQMTVPQIFIGGTHIGGCDDLYALEKDGKLDSLLNAS